MTYAWHYQVVGLTLFDLRRLGKVCANCRLLMYGGFIPGISQVDKLSMVGVNGSKFPAIREHLDSKIGQVYKDMDTS